MTCAILRDAENGTLFLDHIEALPKDAQELLLIVLLDEDHHVETRLLSGTRDSMAFLSVYTSGQFSSRLFYPFQTVVIPVP